MGILRCPLNSNSSTTKRRFYFIGRATRAVIFYVLAASLEDARQKFRASGHSDSDALFIISTETCIYVA